MIHCDAQAEQVDVESNSRATALLHSGREGWGGAARNGMHQLMDNVPIDGNYVGSIVRSACTCLSKLHGT